MGVRGRRRGGTDPAQGAVERAGMSDGTHRSIERGGRTGILLCFFRELGEGCRKGRQGRSQRNAEGDKGSASSSP